MKHYDMDGDELERPGTEPPIGLIDREGDESGLYPGWYFLEADGDHGPFETFEEAARLKREHHAVEVGAFVHQLESHNPSTRVITYNDKFEEYADPTVVHKEVWRCQETGKLSDIPLEGYQPTKVLVIS